MNEHFQNHSESGAEMKILHDWQVTHTDHMYKETYINLASVANTIQRRDPRPWHRPWPWGYLRKWSAVRKTMQARWPAEDLALLNQYARTP